MQNSGEKPIRWRDSKKAQLRASLFETAIELFEKNGYEATLVQEITARVGVAKGTFFNHFPTKEHVVAEWYNAITKSALEAAQKRRTRSSANAVAELFADMATQATRSPELLIAKTSRSIDPMLMEAERVQVAGIRMFLKETCETGIARGDVPTGIGLDAFCDLLIAVLTGTSRAWVYTTPRFNFPKVIRERIKFLFSKAPG